MRCASQGHRNAMRRIGLSQSFYAESVIIIEMMTDFWGTVQGAVRRIFAGFRT